MSFVLSAPLQQAVYAALRDDAALAELVGAAIFDAAPAGVLPPVYVQLGDETVRDASDASGNGAIHWFIIAVVSDDPGFAAAKRVAGAVSDVLNDGELTLSRGQLISLSFERATAKMVGTQRLRRVDMRFRARVQDG